MDSKSAESFPSKNASWTGTRNSTIELGQIVGDFATALQRADAKRPQQAGRNGRMYSAGIGPHHEDKAVHMIVAEMRLLRPDAYDNAGPIHYPSNPRLTCDLAIGEGPEWAIEVKMARAYGDNGIPDASWLKDLISPYAVDRSALTDSAKLRASGFNTKGSHEAILIYGFDYDDRPLELAVDLLEHLLSRLGPTGPRKQAQFSDLVHPIHQRGSVVAWEICWHGTNGKEETA